MKRVTKATVRSFLAKQDLSGITVEQSRGEFRMFASSIDYFRNMDRAQDVARKFVETYGGIIRTVCNVAVYYGDENKYSVRQMALVDQNID